MISKDLLQNEKAVFQKSFIEALESGDKEKLAESVSVYAESLQESILKDARQVVDMNDAAILSARGARVLTSAETKFYEKAAEGMKEALKTKQAVTIIDDVLPETVIDKIFEDITTDHPLLDAINFQNTGAIIKMVLGTSEGTAIWGELCAEITEEVAGGFEILDLTLKKLSAFIPVCEAMLDVGPVWLDRYVREILTEALAMGLELAIVDGDGKDGPRGMTRKLSGDTGGVYPRKDAIAIQALDPVTVGKLLGDISEGRNGKRRVVPSLLFVVNPLDYYTKVYPATTVRAADGTYKTDVFPYQTKVVPSAAVPEGHAVVGMAPRYFMGVGTAGKGGKLEYSDEYKFLEDIRMYKIKMYGNGTALDENAFLYLDISGLKPAVLQVEVTNMVEIPENTGGGE